MAALAAAILRIRVKSYFPNTLKPLKTLQLSKSLDGCKSSCSKDVRTVNFLEKKCQVKMKA